MMIRAPRAFERAGRAPYVGALKRVVLCVDDDPDYLDLLRRMIQTADVEAIGASNADEALARIEQQGVDALIVDINLPGRSGLDLIASLRRAGHQLPILVLTGAPSVSAAVEALKYGAADFLLKPIEARRLRTILAEVLGNGTVTDLATKPAGVASGTGAEPDGFEGMLGRSETMLRVFDAIERVAATDAPVLVVGESGSGKELVARAIHARSPRRKGAFVPVHTGAVPKDLVASEMFGHERGAFTGATTAAEGKFAAANGGSIFLDEIATMVPDVQVVLLRVLETMRFMRVGGRKEHVADVRVVAATNSDLLTQVGLGRFREDLYFRLAVVSIVVPPLRERPEDIELLAEHFLRRFAARYGSVARTFSPEAMAMLVAHSWPGNVRELRNAVERVVVFSSAAEVGPNDLQLETARLPDSSSRLRAAVARAASEDETPPHEVRAVEPSTVVIPLGSTMEEVERQMIVRTLAFVGGNKQKAAQVLGMSRRCIYNRLRQYGLHGAARDSSPPPSGELGPDSDGEPEA